MSNQTAACCEQCRTDPSDVGSETARGGDAAAARWLDADSVLSGPLPDDLAAAASRFYGVASVETLGDFADATRAAAGGEISVADLCHAAGETPHRATAGGETYHFQCFYDGVVLARLRSERVALRTEGPAGTPIESRFAPDGSVVVSPADAAMSFGVAPDALADGDPTPGDVYSAVCPWVRAFPSRERYAAWAAATDAPTVGLPLAAGAPVAAALVAEGGDARPDGNP